MTILELAGLTWKWDPVALAVAAGGAAVIATRRLSWPRRASLATATLLFVLALASPIATLADGYLFSAHMLQHLLLVLAVPPLVLLATGERALGARRRGLPTVVAWGLGVGAMWLWHAPTLCNAAATSPLVHRVQEGSLLLMGAAFWRPVLGGRIAPLISVVYLFGACVACTILGIAVTLSPVQVCSVYARPSDLLGILPTLRGDWGLSAERDQQLGGLLMWVPACVVYLVAILAALRRFYRADEPLAEVP
jgi:cytochrome c oxidase assembly factor CtaG